MTLHFSAFSPATVEADLLILGVSAEGTAERITAALGAFGEQLVETVEAEEWKAKVGSSLVVRTMGALPVRRVCLVGTGEGDAEGLRRAAGAGAMVARSAGDATVALALGALDDVTASAVAEGFFAGSYRFDRYKPEATRKAAPSTVLVLESEAADAALGLAIAAGQAFARDLVNEPADAIYPATLAEAARGLATDRMSVEVWEGDKLVEERMNGMLTVGKGSDRGPRFIHLTYTPEGKPRKRIGLVGKGVTFDAGGLSIKTSAGMLTMRCDMGGAAAVLGVMKAIAEIAPDVEVHGMVGAAENMLGGSAAKLGDIITYRNGKTVEIHNTDAEGRLVMADCLCLASELGLDALVDIATLTGACVVALGEHYTGLFTQDDAVAGELLGSADAAGEGLWRMPLPDFYKDKLKAEWGAVKNVGGRAAGAITAGLFLSEFVTDTPWAHLDIAGPAFLDKTTRHFVAGGTGAMVPTLTRWLVG
jgi:leucyl aminopeptidase